MPYHLKILKGLYSKCDINVYCKDLEDIQKYLKLTKWTVESIISKEIISREIQIDYIIV